MADYPDQILINPLPGPFDVSIRPPGSKSLTNRALLLAALAEGTSTLTGVLFSDDTRVMMRALEDLGFNLDIDEANTKVTVEGRGGKIPVKRTELHLGNAGTAMRFLTAACCLGGSGSEYILDGIPRMRERPIGELVDALRQLGATVDCTEREGYPPVRVHGGLTEGGAVQMKPSTSSQFVSAMLQVGPYLKHGLNIVFVTPPVSQPYIVMSARLMNRFGSNYTRTENFDQIGVCVVLHDEHDRGERIPGPYQAQRYAVEPDASNASYFLAAAAVVPGGACTIDGLGRDSLQGDARCVEVLQKMGAGTVVESDRISVRRQELRGIDVDLNAMPDMAQTLAVVAVFADGPTTIRNVGNLRVKETDRMAAIQKELTKVGATVEINGDDITIHPPADGVIRNPKGGIDTYDDHRMAMAFSILGLRPGGPGITINDPGCVAKTYPGYWDDLGKLRTSAAGTAAQAAPAEGGAV